MFSNSSLWIKRGLKYLVKSGLSVFHVRSISQSGVRQNGREDDELPPMLSDENFFPMKRSMFMLRLWQQLWNSLPQWTDSEWRGEQPEQMIATLFLISRQPQITRRPMWSFRVQNMLLGNLARLRQNKECHVMSWHRCRLYQHSPNSTDLYVWYLMLDVNGESGAE